MPHNLTTPHRFLPCFRVVKSELGDVDGILTFCEIAVPLASRLSEICGLPGNTCLAVDNARNKVRNADSFPYL